MEVLIENKKGITCESELRQDIVTGDWVVIATGRARRPDEFAVQKPEKDVNPHDDPFAHPESSGQEPDILVYRQPDGEWSLRVFPNKYPALSRGKTVRQLSEGPYFAMSGVGYHELFVTRDAHRHIALLEIWQVAELVDAYQERYLSLMHRKSVNYIQIFHNHGKEAGASIAHPHSQMMALPVVSPYIALELDGAERYYKSTRANVYETIVEYEHGMGKRIVFENEHFIAFCPFASRAAFEVWIIGKRPSPYFERINEEEKFALAEALRQALFALFRGLKDPAYNFYLHTAPCNGHDYAHYRWHIEILPRTATWAGLELSTGIEVSTIAPEKAAEYLRSQFK